MTHRFGGLVAVLDFNESLKDGEMVGLIGPNGAGKTTVFNLVSGFYNPSEGSILYQDEEIAGMKPHVIAAKHVARTFQNIRLWPDMTVVENIMLSRHYKLGYHLREPFFRTANYERREKELRDEALHFLEVFGLHGTANEKPRNLPYGVQRKVELARALSIQPRLLMLDEPAAGLNSRDIGELIKLVEWIRSEFDVTIWMIEHQMQVVMSLCERIKVVDFGKIIAEGSPEEIQNNPVVIKAYLGDGEI